LIIALDKHGALQVFASAQEAEQYLEAIDVRQDAIEFCDVRGQRYLPAYTRQPKESRFGPLGVIDIGAFKLVREGDIQPGLAESVVARASHVEHASVPGITSIEDLRDDLRKQI
jgi:hypothetical protein